MSHDIYGIEDGDFGNSGNCQVDINCPEGSAWQDIKRSVVKIIINGTGLCSGALINNTAEDETPYILTAAHCICEQNDAENSVYIFNYESPTCNGVDGSVSQSISGADVRSTSTPSDFSLLELSTGIPNSYDVYYAGWDRRNVISNSGVGIHHPMGDVKKISTYNVATTDSNCMGFNRDNGCGNFFVPNENFWRVNWVSTANGHSVTESGSSGSPLFNDHSRIIGQLWGAGFCNNTNCTNPGADTGNYGKIFSSWDGANAQSRLRDWLDPGNTGNTVLDGMFQQTIDGSLIVCSNTSYTLQNGGATSWQVSSNLLIVSSNATSITVKPKYSSGSTGWIRANFGPGISITKNVQVNNPTLTNNDVFVRDGYYNNLSGSGTYSDPYLICNGGEEHVINMDSNNVNSINYTTIPSGWTSYSYGVYEIAFTPNNMNYGNTYAIDVDYVGACGNSVHTMYFKKDDYCFGGYFKVVPNPITSTELNIVKKNNNETKAFNANNEVEFLLLNDMGVQLKSKKDLTNKKNYTLNIPNLKNGMYYLKVITEKHTEVHRILVDR
ncbi:trypsin-like peptidase domain-containing protein [Hwangdonia seohaensis]|uniref:Trypsin-like peptidase domain-containing protein n=1 Tax=Hwangdonia seohaensis TaxID=1240727 RepID=A0ABW3R755_9FLAO|nr:T9SS type A sorting domain-containing protein [Hwangdonia seohaensis]